LKAKRAFRCYLDYQIQIFLRPQNILDGRLILLNI